MVTRSLASALFVLLLTLQVPDAQAARSLIINVYPHDELGDVSDQQLEKEFFQHWLDEMRSFTPHPIEVVFHRNVQSVTDIDYSDLASQQLLDQFTEAVRFQTSLTPFPYLQKHLLMTRNSYDKRGLNYNAGLAYFKQNTAIASVSHYSAPAHEIGHMLGATHEDAELSFNGWVCETYTHPRMPARSNCYRYSDQNRANILEYLKYNSN